MPVQHAPTRRWGSTGQLHLVVVRDPIDLTSPMIGVRHDVTGAAAAYVRDHEPVVRFPLTSGRPGSWTPGGFVEMDSDLAPGVYQLGVPDEVFAEGASRAMVLLRFDGALVDPIEFDLVAFDPADTFSIGIQELQNATRHRFLRRAMPNLTEETLDRGEETERVLSARLRGPGGR
jgi:hypothetical protein